ncbi:hypothetical protein Tco_0084811 [Tanacetum coccineum]
MSSMGELTFFLGLQVKQKPDGIFISQDKYVAEILKKFHFANVKTVVTLRLRSLLFQVTPKSSHLSAIKRIFSTMAVLDSCPKHNMVAYLEKFEGNAEFHEIIDFLSKVPFIMLSLYIVAKVAGKSVSISEASIRSDLLFDDADGIDTLPNQAIFDAIQLMGVLLQERPSEAQSNLPCSHSEVPQSKNDSFLLIIVRNLERVSYQAKEIQDLKAQITKLKKQAKPIIKHYKAWLKSVSLKQRFPRKSFSKEHMVHRVVIQTRRKFC